MDTREFLLEENRQTLERMQRDRDSVNNLQWKYDNLDQLYITQQRFEKMAKQIETMEDQLQDIKRRKESSLDEGSDVSRQDAQFDDPKLNKLDTRSNRSRRSFVQHSGMNLLDAPAHSRSRRSANKISRKNSAQQTEGEDDVLDDEEDEKPIMAVEMKLQDVHGENMIIHKKDSFAAEESKSFANMTSAGRSATSKAQSKLSRKNREIQFQKNVDMLMQNYEMLQEEVENLKSQVENWRQNHENPWQLCSANFPVLEKILLDSANENGFVGQKTYDLNPLGSAAGVFNEMQEVLEDQTQREGRIIEDMALQKEENQRQLDCISRATKSLQDQKLRRDEYDDQRIKAHLSKAMKKMERNMDDRVERVMDHIASLQEPLNAKFLDMSKESEGLARQNMRFMKLYRECLQELAQEIREKKSVLDTSQLAFLTADPGLVQQKIQAAVSTYHGQKKCIHGVPSQNETGQIWSRYTSEAAQLKLDDLQVKIQEAERDLEKAQHGIQINVMQPKAITIGDCFDRRKSASVVNSGKREFLINATVSNITNLLVFHYNYFVCMMQQSEAEVGMLRLNSSALRGG